MTNDVVTVRLPIHQCIPLCTPPHHVIGVHDERGWTTPSKERQRWSRLRTWMNAQGMMLGEPVEQEGLCGADEDKGSAEWYPVQCKRHYVVPVMPVVH